LGGAEGRCGLQGEFLVMILMFGYMCICALTDGGKGGFSICMHAYVGA
jgi:hypothetical protein